MKSKTLTKGTRVENIDKETREKGIIAFQMVKFEINYFGSIVETITDTWIMSDGRQIVSGGCGFIKDGYEIK